MNTEVNKMNCEVRISSIEKITVEISIENVIRNFINSATDIIIQRGMQPKDMCSVIDLLIPPHNYKLSPHEIRNVRKVFRDGYAMMIIIDVPDFFEKNVHREIIVKFTEGEKVVVYHEDINF